MKEVVEQIEIHVAGHPAKTLSFYPEPTQCRSIDDGVAFSFRNEGMSSARQTVTSDLLTVEQAAVRYHKTLSAMYEFLRRRPWLPVTRIGRVILIDPQAFEVAMTKRANEDRDRRERERNRRYFRRAS